MMAPRILALRIRAPDATRAAEIYVALGAVHIGEAKDAVRLWVGNARLELAEPVRVIANGASATRRTGVTGIELAIADIDMRADALRAHAITFERAGAWLSIPAESANGVGVELGAVAPADERAGSTGMHLDHLAVGVRNLSAASRIWQGITGSPAQQLGAHPISGGAFAAARIPLGDQMIELISPIAGRDSALAKRLASHGEGAVALALPVSDLEGALHRLRALGARLVRQRPHWMVHPIDAGGVLVQLTPRVGHGAAGKRA